MSLLKLSSAIVFEAPLITPLPTRVGLEVVLAPTARPICHLQTRGLRVRQESVSLATCGFIGGDAGELYLPCTAFPLQVADYEIDLPVTCGTDLYCATTSRYVGCCEAANCVGIFTTCYDLLGNSCDATCQNNPDNLVW